MSAKQRAIHAEKHIDHRKYIQLHAMKFRALQNVLKNHTAEPEREKESPLHFVDSEKRSLGFRVPFPLPNGRCHVRTRGSSFPESSDSHPAGGFSLWQP